MSEPFIAEIRIFSFNFAPRSWAQCNGQLLPIAQNTALFSLLGTSYGGNGQTNFALPNLQGQVPMFWGQGPGENHALGETGGSQSVNLQMAELPAHTHNMTLFSAAAPTSTSPQDQYLADGTCKPFGSSTLETNALLNAQAVSVAGNSQAHNNLMPSLVVNFCIALEGVFPSRP
jgi:microcystin-dependent protein